MITQTITFLAELKENNNRDWFLLHKSKYEQIKDWLDNTLVSIIAEVSKFDPNLQYLTPPDCTYRQNRDVRFSSDKSAYKTHIGAILKQGGKKNGEIPGYYFQIDSTGKLFVGGGWYMIDSKQLFKLRTDIQKNPEKLLAAIQSPSFKKTYGQISSEKLVSTPRGFAKTDPNIELLRYKSYTAFREINIASFSQQQLEDFIIESFKAVSPLVKYLTEIKNQEV